jgi:hypothetical protein
MRLEATVAEGKYTIISENGVGTHALRYGEPWRDLTGDGMVLAMLQEIVELRAMITAHGIIDE